MALTPTQAKLIADTVTDPVQFASKMLGMDCWAKQAKALRLCDIPQSRTVIKSCHSSGKCVAGSEYVTLSDGRRVLAKDLIGKDFNLLTLDPADGSVVEVKAHAEVNAHEAVYALETESGRRIVRNAHHPLWKGIGYFPIGNRCQINSVGWAPLKDFDIGDLVAVSDELPAFGNLPMDEDEIKILAYLIGDGGCNRPSQVNFSQLPGKQLDEFRDCCSRLDCKVTYKGCGVDYSVTHTDRSARRRTLVHYPNSTDKSYPYQYESRRYNKVLDLVRKHGINKLSKEKRLPSAIFSLPKDQVILFLSRLYSTDGWATCKGCAPQIGYASASHGLILDVQELLIRLGISPRIEVKPYTNSWTLSIAACGDVIRFCDIVGIYGKETAIESVWNRASEQFRSNQRRVWRHKVAPQGTRWERVASVEMVGVEDTVAIEVPIFHTFLTQFYEHNTRCAASAVLWWLARWEDCVVVTTAPCYDDQTEILTENGWKLFKDLDDGEKVAQVHEDGLMEMVTPMDRYEFPYSGDLMGYQSQLVDFLVTPDHRMWVDPNPNGKGFKGTVRRAHQVYGKNCKVRRQVSWKGKSTGITKTWAEFLGYWFAEGWAEFNPVPRKYRVTLTTKNDQGYAKDLLERNGLKYSVESKPDGAINLVVYDKGLAEEFVTYGHGALNKRIPECIRQAKPEIIKAFLHGFWIGDGCTDSEGSQSLLTASIGLAGDLQELQLKVGEVSNQYTRDNTTSYEKGGRFSPRDSYAVRSWKRRGQFPRLKSEASPASLGWYKKPYSGYVHCVHVPTGLVMVRRNGKPLVCGQTWVQVEKLLWGEVHSMVSRSKYPFPEPNKTELKLGPKRYAFGLSTSVTEQNEGVRFQGVHAEHVLIVIDEAPGVNPKIWSAIDGIRAGGDVRILALGNPTIPTGPFADAFGSNGVISGWNAFTISSFDTPNFEGIYLRYVDAVTKREVVLGDPSGRDLLSLSDTELDYNSRPYLTTKRWVKEKFYEWGPGHYLWDSRVMGNFPSQSEDSLLSVEWIEAAATSTREAIGTVHFGLDVAGPGEDETVLTARRGPRILFTKAWANPDPRGEVMQEIGKFSKDQIGTIKVDSAGIGWGMFTHIRDEYKDKVIPINVGESPSNSKNADKYANLKAELYWNLRERFEAGEIAGDLDPVTKKQLASIRYKPTSKGKTEIESKKDLAKRGVRSPDRAESIMLAFADINQMLLSALEHIREEVVMRQTKQELAKVATSAMIKPELTVDSAACPECESHAIITIHGHKHCNMCGLDYGHPAQTTTMPSRGDYLAKGKR